MYSIDEYLDERLGQRSRSSSRDREYVCPFCIQRVGTETNKKKLRINVAKGVAYCHRCDYKSNTLERLIKDLNNGKITIEELRLVRKEAKLAEGVSLGTAIQSVMVKKKVQEATPLLPVPLPDHCKPITTDEGEWSEDPQVKSGVAYAKLRGCTAAKARDYKIQYAVKGKAAGYLIFPAYQYGVQVYWTSRYAGECPHYIPPDQFKKTHNIFRTSDYVYGKSDVLLNFDNCVGQHTVAIVEGPFTGISMPVPSVVTLGKIVSAAQFELLCALAATGVQEFITGLDPDAVRHDDALAQKLRGLVPKVTQLPLLHGDASSRQDEIAEIVENRQESRSFYDRILLRISKNK